MSRRCAALCLLAGILFLSTGCAVVERHQLLDSLDSRLRDTFVTETVAGRIACAPVLLPVALGATAIDAAIINPSVALPESLDTTHDVLWSGSSGSPFHDALLFGPKVIATPFVFLAVWTPEWLFFD